MGGVIPLSGVLVASAATAVLPVVGGGLPGMTREVLGFIPGVADWDKVDDHISTLGTDSDTLFDTYVDSIAWAVERMDSHTKAA